LDSVVFVAEAGEALLSRPELFLQVLVGLDVVLALAGEELCVDRFLEELVAPELWVMLDQVKHARQGDEVPVDVF